MERRLDPRTREWTTFASHRQDRTFLPASDACPLCPTDAGGRFTEIPEAGFQIAVFDNRFPSFVSDPPAPDTAGVGDFAVAPSRGAAEVVVYSPDHSRLLGDMPVPRIQRVIDVWADRYAVLGDRSDVGYVLIFENRGVEVGVTLHHPHGQIYAYPDVPPRALAELTAARAHLERTERCVFCDAVGFERREGARMLVENQSFIAFVPFAARMPYEVHIMARRHAASLLDLSDPERYALADVLRRVLRGYDAVFGFPMPYVLAIHQSPTDDGRSLDISHLHIEIVTPYRTAEKLKYLAGSELAAGAFMNDAMPEETAAQLRDAIAAASP